MKRFIALLVIVLVSILEVPCDARKSTQAAVVELGEAYAREVPQGAFKKAVAILPIKVPAELGRGGAGDAIEAYVREKISLSTVFVLVERANMEAILSEIELGLSGMVDPSNSAKAGELLGAELLVQGSLSESGANLVLSLELVDASTARIIASVTRQIPRSDVVAGASEYLRSSFQSQYGLAVYGSAGLAFATTPVWVPDFISGDGEISYTGPVSFVTDAGVSYKPLPWLGLNLGFLGIDTPQFYLSEDGKVLSPLPTAVDRSVRYTVFSGSGLSLGAAAIYSPTPRINLGLSANGFVLINPKMTHWFMDFLNWDIVGDEATGDVSAVNRDIVIEGTKFGPSFGVFGKTRFEYLISRRMSLGLEGGYLWMPPFIPDRYVTGNHIQASNTADAFPTYMDKNGTFDFMGLFNVARVDGTTGSALIEFNPSSVYATLYLAVHF